MTNINIDHLTGITTITAKVKLSQICKVESNIFLIYVDFGIGDVKFYISKDIYNTIKQNGNGIYELYCIAVTDLLNSNLTLGVAGVEKL